MPEPELLWQDDARPPDERVRALIAEMTLEEKLAQLGSVWLGKSDADADLSPVPGAVSSDADWSTAKRRGVGHITRVFGSFPVSPGEGVKRLADLQRELSQSFRLGIPAVAHEECLTGFAAHGATIFPTPLALAATFNPGIVERMTSAIGETLHSVGVHQGLAPLLDVVRDYRWGRTEETFGEDPYLVGMIGTAYVQGLQSSKVVATPKHFVGYSGSRAGRNHAPVSIGPRELADVFLPPFEMALREGGAGAVMNSYAALDGVVTAAEPRLLTDLLRDRWGFTGVVTSDYSSVSHLVSTQGVAATAAQAGSIALEAGIDVELPETVCFGGAMRELVQSGQLSESLIDRALARVLLQKLQHGLLSADWSPERRDGEQTPDFDPPGHRELARQIAEQSVILLANEQRVLPLDSTISRLAVIGPASSNPNVFLGCYALPNHLRGRVGDFELGVAVPTLIAALEAEFPQSELAQADGCEIESGERAGIAGAVAAAQAADVAVVAVGDLAGMFGHGTSGEGNDVEDLTLPGLQSTLVDAVLETGTPTILVVISGRPYALGAFAARAAAIIQVFLPGEEGGSAIAGVLSGRITPTAKLPVQIPARAGGQPHTYLHPVLGGATFGVSAVAPRALYPFGHGLSYTDFSYSELRLSSSEIDTAGTVTVTATVSNIGDRDGAEIVQLYAHDPVAEVARPVKELIGFARVELAAKQSADVSFTVHSDRFSYTGRALDRIVEPGDIELMLGASSENISLSGELKVVGRTRTANDRRVLTTPVTINYLSPNGDLHTW